MKRFFVLLLTISILSFSLCGCFNSASDTDYDDSSSSKNVSDISSEETSSESTKITEEEAIEIASNHWGIKSGDIDEGTGFQFLIMPVESNNEYIRVDLKWLVNGANYSTLDTVYIDPMTGEIVSY